MSHYVYDVFGLRIRLPHVHRRLRAADPQGAIDVDVRYGSVPTVMPHVASQFSDEEMQAHLAVGPNGEVLWSASFARFYVAAGREVIVELVQEDRKPAGILRFVISYCLPAALIQRGHLALHANAIATSAGAVVISGVSGAGKSTLAAALMSRGYPLLSDDVTAISVGVDRCAWVASGFPVYRLCPDTMQRVPIVAQSTHALGGVRGKFAVVAPESAFRSVAAPLKAVYIIEKSDRPIVEITELRSLDKIAALRAVCYPPLNITNSQPFLSDLAKVARLVPVYRLTRPHDCWTVDEMIRLVTEESTDAVCVTS